MYMCKLLHLSLIILLAEFEVMCMFKALHKDSAHTQPHQGISREEFYSFYEVQGMRWKQVGHTIVMHACVVHRVRANGVDQHQSIYIDATWN